jgi:hypothetical protein
MKLSPVTEPWTELGCAAERAVAADTNYKITLVVTKLDEEPAPRDEGNQRSNRNERVPGRDLDVADDRTT